MKIKQCYFCNVLTLVQYTFQTQLTPLQVAKRLQENTIQPRWFPFWLFTSGVAKPLIGVISPTGFRLKNIKRKVEPLLCVKGQIEPGIHGTILRVQLRLTPYMFCLFTISLAVCVYGIIWGLISSNAAAVIVSIFFTLYLVWLSLFYYRLERDAWHRRLKRMLYAAKTVRV